MFHKTAVEEKFKNFKNFEVISHSKNIYFPSFIIFCLFSLTQTCVWQQTLTPEGILSKQF